MPCICNTVLNYHFSLAKWWLYYFTIVYYINQEGEAKAKRRRREGEPSWAEQSRAEPNRVEQSRAEPSWAETSRAEPSWAEPSRAEPSRVEPSVAEPAKKILWMPMQIRRELVFISFISLCAWVPTGVQSPYFGSRASRATITTDHYRKRILFPPRWS